MRIPDINATRPSVYSGVNIARIKRIPFHIYSCLFGIGLGSVTSCHPVFASSSLPFRATASSRNPQGTGVQAFLSGSAELHPTGKIFFKYKLLVELFIGKSSQGPCGMRVNILFNLVNKDGHILESFSENYVHGSQDALHKTYPIAKEIVSQTSRIDVYVNLVD
jgi:hypothetical protein